MFNLNEEKIEFTFGTRIFVFLAGQKSQECCLFISDVGIRGIYLSLTLGTALLLYIQVLKQHFPIVLQMCILIERDRIEFFLFFQSND